MLTTSQKVAKKKFLNDWWFTNKKFHKPFKLGGAAGTGKTFWVNHILEELQIPRYRVLVVSYTGQAVSVLRRRGVQAYTIYSKYMTMKMVPKLDENGKVIHRDGIPYKIPSWEPVEELDFNYDLVIVEEASFVNKRLAKIINGFMTPVLYVGDHVQLPPVTGEPYFHEDALDAVLEDPMRQAEGSDLLRYLTSIRRMEKIDPYEYRNGIWFLKGSVNRTFTVFDDVLGSADMIICATNKQRNEVTTRYRERFYNTDNPLPVKGERLICRKNRWNYKIQDYPLVNGTIGYNLYDIAPYDVDRSKRTFYMDFQPKYIRNDYYDHMICDLDFISMPFGEKELPHYRTANFIEHGACITAHLSQGDQYKTVFYMPAWNPDPIYKRRLDYTAASRAEKYLFVLNGDY